MSGARHVHGVGNATQARHLVLPATRPAVGDRVRLPATTFAATGSWRIPNCSRATPSV
ncbi:hypothetical protein EAO75_45080 [Streptomyces sp. uw30]|nr:hypothetical protein EAO75_45080 [Streptomyces sp. uw30]